MGIPKKRGRSVQTSDDDCEQAVEELADAVAESLKEPSQNPFDAFEVYVQRMRAKVHSESRHFKARFSRGYSVLMTELAKKHRP